MDFRFSILAFANSALYPLFIPYKSQKHIHVKNTIRRD